jgi:hypothetical protein
MAFQPASRTATCHRFKSSGKWYDEFDLDMSLEQGVITAPEAVEAALTRAGRPLGRFTYLVMDPAHPQAVPVMLPATVG